MKKVLPAPEMVSIQIRGSILERLDPVLSFRFAN